MLNVDIFVDIATAALAVLIAVLACYLALRLLGQIAKFLVIVVVILLVAWFVFGNGSPISGFLDIRALGALPPRFC